MTKAYDPRDDWPESPADATSASKTVSRQTVHLDVTGGVGRLLVNGVDISRAVVEVTTVTTPRQPTKVIVGLMPGQLWLKTDRAQVDIDSGTRDLLVSLGWTPPAVAQNSNDVQD